RWGASEDRHSPPGDLALGQLVDVLRDLLEGDGHDLGLDVAARHEPEYLLGLGLLAVRGADEGDLLEDDLLHAQGGLLAGQPDLHDAPAVPDGVDGGGGGGPEPGEVDDHVETPVREVADVLGHARHAEVLGIVPDFLVDLGDVDPAESRWSPGTWGREHARTGSVMSRMARRLFLVIEVRQEDEPWIDHSGVLGGRAGSPYGRGATGNGCPQRGAPWWSARPSSASSFEWSPRLFILTVPDEQVQGPVDA